MRHSVVNLTTAILAIAATAGPALAQSFKASNRSIVNPVPGGFEVIEGEMGGRGMWCGAADYAKSVLGASGTDRVYIATARGNSISEPGRKGVVFTLDPAGLTPRNVLIVGSSVREPGSNLSVDHAHIFCDDYKLRSSR